MTRKSKVFHGSFAILLLQRLCAKHLRMALPVPLNDHENKTIFPTTKTKKQRNSTENSGEETRNDYETNRYSFLLNSKWPLITI